MQNGKKEGKKSKGERERERNGTQKSAINEKGPIDVNGRK